MTDLVYMGDGSTWVTGAPARDITADELAELEAREGLTRDALLASGLYAPAKPARATAPAVPERNPVPDPSPEEFTTKEATE